MINEEVCDLITPFPMTLNNLHDHLSYFMSEMGVVYFSGLSVILHRTL